MLGMASFIATFVGLAHGLGKSSELITPATNVQEVGKVRFIELHRCRITS